MNDQHEKKHHLASLLHLFVLQNYSIGISEYYIGQIGEVVQK